MSAPSCMVVWVNEDTEAQGRSDRPMPKADAEQIARRMHRDNALLRCDVVPWAPIKRQEAADA